MSCECRNTQKKKYWHVIAIPENIRYKLKFLFIPSEYTNVPTSREISQLDCYVFHIFSLEYF